MASLCCSPPQDSQGTLAQWDEGGAFRITVPFPERTPFLWSQASPATHWGRRLYVQELLRLSHTMTCSGRTEWPRYMGIGVHQKMANAVLMKLVCTNRTRVRVLTSCSELSRLVSVVTHACNPITVEAESSRLSSSVWDLFWKREWRERKKGDNVQPEMLAWWCWLWGQ